MASKGLEKLKFTLFAIVTLSLLGIFGYWAIATIQSGTEHAKSERIESLQKENGDLKKEVAKLESDLGTAQAELGKVKEPAPVISAPTTYKYQTLIDELQKLIDGKVVLKLKSRGSRVGTVQKFLNIYNDTTGSVDNDYGVTTVKLVTAFQKDAGLSASGEAGVDTFTKMIEWLKKQ